ncbi:UNVERIFIED_CONTAM: hypothetical protein RMT77_003227 [Armadillidium vulgare]
MIQINDLPQEILEYILYFVSPYDDLKSCRLVCQRWYLSCLGVVKKRKSMFSQALKCGIVQWYTPNISNQSNAITRRYSHSACIYDSFMYIFGGCTATNTTFNDLWKFHLGTYEWTRLLTTGTYPSPKAYASMVSWKNNLILFGGWTHPSVYPLHQQWVLFNELHIYDILANRWTQCHYSGSPPPTAGHTATVHGNIVVLFGGLQKQECLSSSTNDIYCLNLENECWYKPLVSSLKPQPRYGHSQIKLDERHILVMAGCGGSNKLYSDIWLLTLPVDPSNLSSEWLWEVINIKGLENMPSQIWYNPACKVGDNIVILSTWKCEEQNSGASGNKMHQLLVPGNVRRQPSNIWNPNSNPNILVQEPPLQAEHNNIDNLELNINGQRGALRSPPVREASASSSDENSEGNPSRSRARPSIRPNASRDRERMLQVLSRMEEKIKSHRNVGANCGEGSCSSKHKDKKIKNSHSVLVPHLLDISKAITCKSVVWLSVAVDNEGNPPFMGIAPQPSLLYTLFMGRGHLIMFGGIPNDPIGIQNQEAVSNHVNYISAPSIPIINKS